MIASQSRELAFYKLSGRSIPSPISANLSWHYALIDVRFIYSQAFSLTAHKVHLFKSASYLRLYSVLLKMIF